MPALPNVANVIRLQLKHSSSLDVDVLDRIYLQYTGTAPTNTGLASMATTVATAWNTDLAGMAPSTITLTEVLLEDLTSPTSAVGLATVSHAGTRSGSHLSAAVCSLMNFQVARRYRGGKPRCYLPYGVQGDLNGTQNWTTAFQSALDTAWASFVTATIAAAPSGTTITGQVNVSYYNGFTSVQNPITLRWRNVPKLRTTPVVDAIVGSQMSIVVASQRRRNTA